MDRPSPIPISLKIVAALFLLGGIASAIDVVLSLAQGHIKLNFGVLGLFIGIGLLRYQRGWRTCALVFLWISFVSAPLIVVVFAIHSGPLDFNLFGQKFGTIPKSIGLIVAGLMILLTVWKYRVLTAHEIRRQFLRKNG